VGEDSGGIGGGGALPGNGTGESGLDAPAGRGGGAMPTIVMPPRGAAGGAEGGAAEGAGGAPTMVGAAADVGGCPGMVVATLSVTRTEKTRSHCGQRTFNPSAGIFWGSTSYPVWHCGQVIRMAG
jgi:hypothetical protein